jgi:hypothetical protein
MGQETWEATCAVQCRGGTRKAVAETGDVTTDGLGFIKGRKEGRKPLSSALALLHPGSLSFRFSLVLPPKRATLEMNLSIKRNKTCGIDC